ncbi:MAG: hypothetical protein M1831_000628 [Alyxoria varia]|nr:MAG: hypothetical protein M1831_000628 [Alyxoria varia]
MTTSHQKNPPLPPLLAPHFRLDEQDSLTLLTGVNAANANWLVIRFLYAALGGASASTGHAGRRRPVVGNPEANGVDTLGNLDGEEYGARGRGGAVNVVLVSWLREWEFWRTECKRAVGIDLTQMKAQGRLAFVDGLSELFLPDVNVEDSASRSSPSNTSPRSSKDRSTPAPAGTSATPQSRSLSTRNESSNTSQTLQSPTLRHIQDTIERALDSLYHDEAPRKILLIFDHPSMLLQTTTDSPITSQDLSSFILDLRLHPSVHSTVVSLPADTPLLKAAAQSANATADKLAGVTSSSSGMEASKLTPLEVENAATTVQTAMLSRCVMSCRALETGWASDVSGVLRITRGGAGFASERDDNAINDLGRADGEESKGDSEEGEWLYHIASDSSVSVWSRGSSAGTR